MFACIGCWAVVCKPDQLQYSIKMELPGDTNVSSSSSALSVSCASVWWWLIYKPTAERQTVARVNCALRLNSQKIKHHSSRGCVLIRASPILCSRWRCPFSLLLLQLNWSLNWVKMERIGQVWMLFLQTVTLSPTSYAFKFYKCHILRLEITEIAKLYWNLSFKDVSVT